MVHRQFAVVGAFSLGHIVFVEGLLQQEIACVGVVAEHLGNGCFAPSATLPGGDAVRMESVGNGHDAFAGEVFGKDSADDFCLRGFYD